MQEITNDNNVNEEAIPQEEAETMKNENAEATNEKPSREVELILELETKLQAAETEVADLKDKFFRKAAEFENYKRRTEQEQITLIKYGGEQLATKILPVIDDLDRSLQHANETTDIKKLIEGVTLIYDKFIKILGEQGIKKFESVGLPFDVTFHDAILQQISAEHPANTVLHEVLAGYMYKDKVLRHAQVIVSSEPEENAPAQQ